MSLTLEQVIAIRAALTDTRSIELLAESIGLPLDVVLAKMNAMDSPLPRRSLKRPCLGCDGRFRSQWIGHRICDDCKERPTWRFGAYWGWRS